MSLRDETIALRSSLDKFFAQVTRKLTSKPARVAQSDSSPLLGGKSPTELKALADTATNVHANDKTNPHKDTAASVGAYSKTEIDAKIADLLPSGVLPLSRFGSLNYLPPDISGTFDGSTTLKDVPGTAVNYREQYSFQLENDGTLVFLRNGTNGSTQGVYYGYVKDAVNGLENSNFVATVTRYAPPFLTAGQSVAYLYQGGHGIVAGRIREANGNLGNCFVALTNGTLDARAHTAVIISNGYEDILNTSELIIGPDAIYFLVNPQESLNGEGRDSSLDFRVYRINLGSFSNTNPPTVDLYVLGRDITAVGFGGVSATVTNSIRLATKWQSNVAGDSALVYHANPPNSWFQSNIREADGHGRMMTCSIMSDDRTSIRVFVYHDSLFQTSNLLDLHIEYSFVWNIANNTVQLDSGLNQVVLRQDASGVLSATGSVLSGNNTYRFNGQQGFDSSTRLYISEAGLAFSSRVAHVANDNDGIVRTVLSNFTSRFAALKAPISPVSNLRRDVTVMYGSAWGDSFDAPRLLPDNQIVGLTRNNDGSRFARGRYAASGAQASPGYSYTSITQGSLTGFAPQTDRATVARDADYLLFLNEVNASGTTARGSVLNELVKLSSFVTMDASQSKTGSVSLTTSQIAAIKSAALNLAGIANAKSAVAEVVIPQNANMPPYAVVNYTTTGLVNGAAIVKLVLSARTGTIASVSVDSLIANLSIDTNISDNSLSYNDIDSRRGGNHFIYDDGGNGFMVVGSTATLYLGFNYARYLAYRFYVNVSDGSVQYQAGQMLDWGVPRERPGAFPGQGVGTFAQTDYTTKLLFKQYAKTKADMASWAWNNTQYVVMEQDVAQGWQVYFTNPTPVILSGKAYTLPVKMIDLRDITSSYTNKTFYLCVKLVNGVATWDISLTAPTDSPTSLFIGTIVTGGSAITGINVAKQTRLDEFHISTTASGQGIPVSSGLPSQSSALDTSWIP